MDIDYIRAREQTERALGRASIHAGARDAHTEMADRYRDMLDRHRDAAASVPGVANAPG